MDYKDDKEFMNKISSINSAVSKQGKVYINISINLDNIKYTRNSSGSTESISLKEIHELYHRENFVDTKIARNYITGWKFSPTVAILKAAGLYDKNGNRNK